MSKGRHTILYCLVLLFGCTVIFGLAICTIHPHAQNAVTLAIVGEASLLGPLIGFYFGDSRGH